MQDGHGRTALINVLRHQSFYYSLKFTKLLLKNGANIHTQDNDGLTVLSRAFNNKIICTDIIETGKLLLEYGAIFDINIPKQMYYIVNNINLLCAKN